MQRKKYARGLDNSGNIEGNANAIVPITSVASARAYLLYTLI
jgi:hypothetical protein